METAFKLIKIEDLSSGVCETMYAEELGKGEFKIAETSAFNCNVNYGTIVKANENDNAELVFEKVLKVSDYTCRRFLFSSKLSRTEMDKLGAPILAEGGYWEVLFGAVLCVHLLSNSKFDLLVFFNGLQYYPTEITAV
ncbi:MAG: hypothetical protein JWQ27_71 [Ferruginibacter sp.]|nr:hypothetical protein [Ferruginibacter sp.]